MHLVVYTVFHSFGKTLRLVGSECKKKKKNRTVNFLNSQMIEFLLILAPTFHNKCQSFLTEI